ADKKINPIGSFDVKYGVFCRGLHAFWGEINHPTARGITTYPFTHTFKPRAVKVSSRCNKADHTICGMGDAFKDFPHRPTPKINIKVFQHILVSAIAFFAEIIKRRMVSIGAAFFDPAAQAFGLVFVGRVSDTDLYRSYYFDAVSALALLCDELQGVSLFAVGARFWVFESIGDVKVHSIFGKLASEFLDSLAQA